MGNACSREDLSWIHVRTNWAYRPEGCGSFRTKMPKIRKFCPDKNGGFWEILGSNLYEDYHGSSLDALALVRADKLMSEVIAYKNSFSAVSSTCHRCHHCHGLIIRVPSFCAVPLALEFSFTQLLPVDKLYRACRVQ
jgi:hypothetical protein